MNCNNNKRDVRQAGQRGGMVLLSTKPSLTLEFVQTAGLSFGQEVGVGVFPGIDFAHEEGF